VLRVTALPYILAALISGAGSPALANQPDSGIEGQVSIGPTCPVEVVGSPCPNRPYQATITVLDGNGDRITQFETDKEGRFHVSLAPGIYTLVPEPAHLTHPHADKQSVRVTESRYTKVTISYDSGLR
jgi:hypothetical protein